MRNSRALRELGLRNLANLFFLYCLKGSGLFHKFVQVRPLMASIKVTDSCNSKMHHLHPGSEESRPRRTHRR